MAKVILKAQDLDGYLTAGDKKTIENMDTRFGKSLELFRVLADETSGAGGNNSTARRA